MTLCCKAVVWLGNILRNKNENIQHPWFLSVPEGALTKINTRDKVFPWMLSAWIIPHVIFFLSIIVMILFILTLTTCNLLTHLDNHFESRCLLATSSNSRTAIIFNSTSSSKITDMKLLVMGFIFLNGSARLRFVQFVSKSINLFYLCQLISLSNLFYFRPCKTIKQGCNCFRPEHIEKVD